MKAEKYDRPGKIKSQLQDVNGPRGEVTGRVVALFPNEVCGYGDEDINTCPNRREKPGWRIKNRFVQGAIPTGNFGPVE